MWMAMTTWPWRDGDATALLSIAAGITPSMCWHGKRVLLLDLGASLQWLGGVRGVKERVRRELGEMAMVATITMATSALGAYLLLWHARPDGKSLVWRYALSKRRLAQRLDRLPLQALPDLEPHQRWLEELGCRRMGQLRALPRQAFAERTGPGLLQALDQAYGDARFQYQALRLPDQFEQRLLLPYHIEQSSALAPHLKQLLQNLCDWLKQRHLSVSRLECRLYHHDRRRARRPSFLMLAVSESTDRQSVLWRWLQIRLEMLRLPAPVTQIVLFSRTLNALQPHNGCLFADDLSQRQQLLQTIDQLRARLGDQGVRQPVARADYRPEVANHWSGADAVDSNRTMTSTLGPHAPAWLLEQPRPLLTHENRPCLQGPLHLVYGPYRIETGWWQDRWALRDYFVATDRSARRYWIYRERDHMHARWFLHGLFG